MARRPQDRTVLVAFGAHLRRVREAAKLTQVALAERVRMKPATISLFESGTLAPSLTTLMALAKALGVEPREMLASGEVCPEPEGALENEVLSGFQKLGAEDQARVVDMVRRLGV